MKASERFLKYVTFDTQSNSESPTCPSTPGQLVFGDYLLNELKQLGIDNAEKDENGYIYAFLPASKGKENLPTLALFAHMDTAMDMSGKDIKAQVIKNYDGNDVVLNEKLDIICTTKQFPSLKNYVGQDMIFTDGTTLLGTDDKAGVSEIITLAEKLLNDSSIPHPPIRIVFTPDEEIGRGVNHINMDKVNAQYAYTLDGAEVGDFDCENFNAATAVVTVNGITTHPGTAKGVLLNACLLAMEYNSLLPTFDIPAYTEGREGFFHLTTMTGKAEVATLSYAVRDHDIHLMEKRKETMQKIAAYLNDKYQENIFHVDITDRYYNMIEKIKPHPFLIDNAVEAMKQAGVEASILPVRGGTDGARLSFMGLPCPNICTGGENAHSRYEFISIQSMDKVVEILTNLVQIYAEKEYI